MDYGFEDFEDEGEASEMEDLVYKGKDWADEIAAYNLYKSEAGKAL